MLLDSKCALLERPKKAKAFDLWIRLSTHEKRKLIYLSVKLHEYFRGFLKRVINNFPKSVKRVLIRFGLGEIKKKLEEVREEYGIEVVYVNPAYSSTSMQ